MQVQLITPEKVLFEGEATYVQIPGSTGEFGVLPHHAPFVSSLRAGVVGVEVTGGAKQEFTVTAGVAEISNNKVTILVD